MAAAYLQLLLIMFRGVSSGKFLAVYGVFGTGPLLPDTLATFRTLLDKPFPRHWRAKLPQQQPGALPGQAPTTQIAYLTIEVRMATGTPQARLTGGMMHLSALLALLLRKKSSGG